jgi:hypothetical protein
MTPVKGNAKKRKRKHSVEPNPTSQGFYSQLFQPFEVRDLEDLLRTGLEDEIAMLRVATRRTFELAEGAENIDQAIKVLGAMGLASIRMSRLLKAQKELGDSDQALSALSDALNDVLKEWGRI